MRVIERSGWTVNIEVEQSDTGEWFLRIDDGRGNATCWVEPFASEQAAYTAAIEAIDAEGIETFIGPDSDLRFLFDS